ncbi:MAG: hypothetical protein FWG78_02960 [Coriobacteriia bacterium]|nr:hypothetical protein [Coriobacteriia bacterium]
MTKLVHSRAVIFLAALLLWSGVFVSIVRAIDPSLDNLTVETGPPPTDAVSSGSLNAPSATTLQPGEVLVGKSVVYNNDPVLGTPDGTVTVTLSVWGQTYTDDGTVKDPLVAMSGGVFVSVTDDIGEFALVGSLPAGLTLSGTTVTWDITDQSTILGPAPLTVSYTLTVVNPPAQPPYTLDYWYSTGTAAASFMPADDNPYYWTTEEVSYNEFTMSMNWNNGTGLNSGAIIDNVLGRTIVFPKNISPQNANPYNTDGSMNTTSGYWNWWPQNTGTRNQAATVTTGGTTQYYTWQLYWEKGSTSHYTFTVKDLDGTGIDIQYEIDFTTGGGNEATPGGRTVISENHFQRTFNSTQDDLFSWDGQTIALNLDVTGRVRLLDETSPSTTFELTIAKEFGTSDFHDRWGMTDDSPFTIRLKDDTTDFDLVFIDNGDGTYTYNGLAAAGTGTLITFSVNNPAVLLDVPTEDENGVQKTYSIAEYFPWDPSNPHAPVVDVQYAVDGGTPADTVTITPTANDDTELTVINTFADPAFGVMNVLKLFNGYPSDWGITSSTVFEMMIWDPEGYNGASNPSGNYLLFVAPDEQALVTDGWTSPGWVEGTLFCVGNGGLDISDPAAWQFSDDYWEDRYDAGTADVLTVISLTELEQVGLSNLWPGPYEVHELDFNGELLSTTSPSGAWWQAVYSFDGVSGTQGVVPPAGILNAMVTNTFVHGESNLSIFKELLGYPQDWDVDDDTVFDIRIWDMTTGNYLLFDPTPLSDGTWRHVGSSDSDGNRTLDDPTWTGDLSTALDYLDLSVNSPIVVSNLFPGTDHHYTVREINVTDGHAVRLVVGGVDITDDTEAGGIVIEHDGSRNATIVNSYLNQQEGKAIVYKQLAGDYADYDVDDDTVFTARATNITEDGKLLLFTQNADTTDPTMSSYTYWGLLDEATGEVYQLQWDGTGGGSATWTYEPAGTLESNLAAYPTLGTGLAISVNKPALLSGLVPDDYQVSELLDPSGTYTASVENGGAIHIEDESAIGVTVINTFDSSILTGSLTINKQLAGDWANWGVLNSTMFETQVVNVDTGNDLAFILEEETAGSTTYTYVGEFTSGGVLVDAEGNPIEVSTLPDVPLDYVLISVMAPATIDGLPQGNYQIVEVDQTATHGTYTATYTVGGTAGDGTFAVTPPIGALAVNATVTNTFDTWVPDPVFGDLTVSKVLQGYPADWSVTAATEFMVRVWDVTNNRVLLFAPVPQPDGSFMCVGNDAPEGGDPVITEDGYAGPVTSQLPVSVDVPLALSNIPAESNLEYAIEELNVADGHTIRFIDGTSEIGVPGPISGVIAMVPDGNVDVTIVNSYLHRSEGRVIIDKQLAGDWAAFASTDTTFTLRLTNERTADANAIPPYLGNVLVFTFEGESASARTYAFMGEIDSDGVLWVVEWDGGTGLPSLVPAVDAPVANTDGTYTWGGMTLYADLTLSVQKHIELIELIPGDYRITEDVPVSADYVVGYSVGDIVHLTADDALGVTVTNTYRATPRPDPDPPPGPGPTPNPDDNGGGSNTNPTTGDSNNLMAWILLLAGALVFLAGAAERVWRPLKD